MKVLVTGGTGLIGSHLLEALEKRHEVHAIARRVPAGAGEGAVNWIEHDLVEPLGPAELPAEIDSVIHLAQSDRYRELPEGAADVFAVNVAASFRLLEYAREAGAGSFVLASTGGLYERSEDPVREGDPISPPDLYFLSKQLAELLLDDFGSGLRPVALRPFFVYGPGSSGMLIPRLASLVEAGKTITVEGSQGMAINPIFVSDAVRVLEQALEGDAAGTFNVAGTETVTISELVALIGEILGVEPQLDHDGEDPGGLVADISRMKDELGVIPEVPLREGIAALLDPETSRTAG